jgi:Transposase DDE domain
MATRKTVCMRRFGGDRGGEEGAGRFFANEKVTAAKIVESWSELTGEAVRGRHVLALQDTTEVSYPTTAERRRGLGQCGHGNAYGVLAHVMLAVDGASGACLGLVGGEVWNRDTKVTTPLRKRVLADRESRRWLNTAEQAKEVLAPAAMTTIIGDRESDMYPIWARIPEAHVHLLIRAQSDRRLAAPMDDPAADGGTLFTAAAMFPLAGPRKIELPARPGHAKRAAELGIRFGTVEICRPVNEKDRTLVASVRLSLVEVLEPGAPEGVEPIHWRLLTTHEVNTEADAWRIVGWYQLRWIIEQLFRVTKSQGLGLEESQMATADRLMKLAAVAIKAACIDMQLVQERDGANGLPASIAFSEPEIDTIEALSPTLEGTTDRQKNPHPLRSLARASWVMARLGGWNCYYKPPGPITMRRGMERFHSIHRGRLLGSELERDVRLL